jgi:hypothetical protein
MQASSPLVVPPLPPTIPPGHQGHAATQQASSPLVVPPLPPTIPPGHQGHVAAS